MLLIFFTIFIFFCLIIISVHKIEKVNIQFYHTVNYDSYFDFPRLNILCTTHITLTLKFQILVPL